MQNFLKLVQSIEELEAFKASESFVTPNVTLVYDNRTIDFNPYVPPHDYSQNYLTFVAEESGTFKFTGNSINYSVDDGDTWTTLASNTDSPTISSGDKIMFKAALIPTYTGIGIFSSSGRFIAQGNPMSLLYGDNFNGQKDLTGNGYVFTRLFADCTGLISAENMSLPATTLASYCYNSMFYGCTSLTNTPELPATTLANNCYQYIFYNCTSLTTAPELPATTLASGCYEYMFKGCTSLTTAPALPATTLVEQCYVNMFSNCTSLTTAPSLPATTLASGCYGNMFSGCTSLTTSPVLPATTLANNCYESMFQGCKSLTTAPELPATTLTNSCYQNMFSDCTNLNSITCLATDISVNGCTFYWVSGVAATGTFIKADSMTDWTTGINGIPSGWTVQDYVAS